MGKVSSPGKTTAAKAKATKIVRPAKELVKEVKKSKKNCFCGIPGRIELGKKDHKKYVACGTTLDFNKKDANGKPKAQVLGCNMFLKEGEVPIVHDAINAQERFNKFKQYDYPMDLADEWPKCQEHNAFLNLKVNPKPGLNHGNVMAVCGISPPNSQCGTFYLLTGKRTDKKVFGVDRTTDFVWLTKHGLLKEAQKMIEQKEQEAAGVVDEEDEEEEEDEENDSEVDRQASTDDEASQDVDKCQVYAHVLRNPEELDCCDDYAEFLRFFYFHYAIECQRGPECGRFCLASTAELERLAGQRCNLLRRVDECEKVSDGQIVVDFGDEEFCREIYEGIKILNAITELPEKVQAMVPFFYFFNVRAKTWEQRATLTTVEISMTADIKADVYYSCWKYKEPERIEFLTWQALRDFIVPLLTRPGYNVLLNPSVAFAQRRSQLRLLELHDPFRKIDEDDDTLVGRYPPMYLQMSQWPKLPTHWPSRPLCVAMGMPRSPFVIPFHLVTHPLVEISWYSYVQLYCLGSYAHWMYFWEDTDDDLFMYREMNEPFIHSFYQLEKCCATSDRFSPRLERIHGYDSPLWQGGIVRSDDETSPQPTYLAFLHRLKCLGKRRLALLQECFLKSGSRFLV